MRWLILNIERVFGWELKGLTEVRLDLLVQTLTRFVKGEIEDCNQGAENNTFILSVGQPGKRGSYKDTFHRMCK